MPDVLVEAGPLYAFINLDILRLTSSCLSTRGTMENEYARLMGKVSKRFSFWALGESSTGCFPFFIHLSLFFYF